LPPASDEPADAKKKLFEARLEFYKELAKAEHSERLEAQKGRQTEDTARLQAKDEAKHASIAAFHNALIEVSKGAIDRARSSAETVQKSATAIATLYTGVLALAFSVAERPLPSRGLVPAILLGWAIVWSTAYLAYLSKSKPVAKPEVTSDFEEAAMRRSIILIEWTRSGAMRNKYALRVAVVALAFGLALLPAPFVNFDPINDEPASLPSGPGWPKPAGADSELGKIRYQARVNEVAELRKSSSSVADDGDDSTWWAIGGIALFLSFAVPAVIKVGDGDDD